MAPVTSITADSGLSSTYYTGLTSTVTVTGSTVTTISFPPTVPPTEVTCPPDSSFVFFTPAITVETDCSELTTWTLDYDCPTTQVVTFLDATIGVVSVDCSLVTVWTVQATNTGTAIATTTAPTTTTPLAVWTTWPPGLIYPVSSTVSPPQATDGGSYQPCTLWFFFICISYDDLHIGGWFWSFPPGIYPPGPPPPINWPPGFTLEGTLPPWPEITIGTDNLLTYSSEPPDSECETETASVCSFTTSFLITSSGTSVVTTATSTSSVVCETIYGCDVSYSATTVLTSSVAACTTTLAAARIRRTSTEPTDVDENDVADDDGDADDYYSYSFLRGRAPSCQNNAAIIYPQDPSNVGQIPTILASAGLTYQVIQSTVLGYTAYFWVEDLPIEVADTLDTETTDVAKLYYYVPFNTNNVPAPNPPLGIALEYNESAIVSRQFLPISVLDEYWNTASISLAAGLVWPRNARITTGGSSEYIYYYDESEGAGVTVYAIGEVNVYTNHPEFAAGQKLFQLAAVPPLGYVNFIGPESAAHGTTVAACVMGVNLGVCKGCAVAYSGHAVPVPVTEDALNPRDWYLEDLLSAWDNMNTPPNTPQTSIINISWGSSLNFWIPQFIITLYTILKLMDRAGVTIVIAAGNAAKSVNPPRTAIDTYPQLFAWADNPIKSLWQDEDDPTDEGYLPNIIIVGASDQYGRQGLFSQTASFLTTYGPGANIWTVQDPDGTNPYITSSGTSYATPYVAGLAGYFKKLPYLSPSTWGAQCKPSLSRLFSPYVLLLLHPTISAFPFFVAFCPSDVLFYSLRVESRHIVLL